MAIDPKDVGELQKALNDAAGKASVLWTTFIIFQFYLAITFGSLTHRDLFLETTIKLPLLSVDLPFIGFFVVAPMILLIFHFYVFLQLLGLASKAKNYNTLLAVEAPVASDRQYMRQRLDVFPILQFLAGPRDQRTGFRGFSLRLIAWITLVATPVLILLQGQVTFLPYHDEWIVWLQRVAVLIDLAVIWYFWIHLRSDDAPVNRLLRKASMYLGGVGTLCVVIFSIYLATFPGEWMKMHLPQLSSLQALLFEGGVDSVTGRPQSIFSNRLVLTDQSFVVDPDKLDKISVSRRFRGRDLRSAVLNLTDLRKADFSDAQLQGASFALAQLQGALFLRAQLQGASLDLTLLQGASLFGAQLEGASLDAAQLQGASLGEAQLQGASLKGAQLQGASLDRAQLQGAFLFRAQLQGASLDEAQLQGAWLDEAQLQGASLNGAQLQDVRGTPNVDLADLRNIDTTPTKLSEEEWPGGVQVLKQGRPIPALDPIFWDVARASQLEGEEGQRKRAEFLVNLACSKASAPYVARGLLRVTSDDRVQQLLAAGLRKVKSDPTDCPGVRGLTEEDWATLDYLIPVAPSHAVDEKAK
jgi:uncharacterized protein YjbI with pentapeptide repeats